MDAQADVTGRSLTVLSTRRLVGESKGTFHSLPVITNMLLEVINNKHCTRMRCLAFIGVSGGFSFTNIRLFVVPFLAAKLFLKSYVDTINHFIMQCYLVIFTLYI